MAANRILAMGVFDLFHVGHLRYLQYARAQGPHLSVGVASDAITQINKAKRPVIPQEQRIEMIRGLGWVDFVDLVPCTTERTHEAAQWIQAWGIDLVVIGNEWAGSARWERLTPLLAQRGIGVVFAPHTEGVSSSQIVARILGDRGFGLIRSGRESVPVDFDVASLDIAAP